jgi:hypothetical protein
MDSLKVLDPERPIREADMPEGPKRAIRRHPNERGRQLKAGKKNPTEPIGDLMGGESGGFGATQSLERLALAYNNILEVGSADVALSF